VPRTKRRPVDGRGFTRVNISVPLALVARLRHYKSQVNVSAVCSEALAFEVERMEQADARSWEEFVNLVAH